MRLALIPVVLALAACGSGAAKPDPSAKPDRSDGAAAMTNARLQACAARSATLVLVEEALLTRTAITAVTAPNHATPVELADGDPRIGRLDTLLRDLPLLPAKLTQFEPRTFLKLRCADGSTLAVEASATEEDGTVHLKIGGDMAATRAPLRKDLEILLGAPA